MAVVLHTGLDHPNLWWIVVPSMLPFLLELVAFVFSGRIRWWLGPEQPVAE